MNKFVVNTFCIMEENTLNIEIIYYTCTNVINWIKSYDILPFTIYTR